MRGAHWEEEEIPLDVGEPVRTSIWTRTLFHGGVLRQDVLDVMLPGWKGRAGPQGPPYVLRWGPQAESSDPLRSALYRAYGVLEWDEVEDLSDATVQGREELRLRYGDLTR